MLKHPTTSLDLTEVARRALSYQPTQLTQVALRELAQTRRRERPVNPSLLDVEHPGTPEALEALRMASLKMASVLERHGLVDCPASIALNEVRGVLATYFTTYIVTQRRK